jgi:hypothetical protein
MSIRQCKSRLHRVARNMKKAAAENTGWLSWWPKGLTLAQAVRMLSQEKENEHQDLEP